MPDGAKNLSRVVMGKCRQSTLSPSVKATADSHFMPFSLDCLSRRHSTASMEPVQLTTAVMTIVNTLRIIVQFMQNQRLKNQARRRWQRSDEDMNTDFSKTMVPGNLEIFVLLGQAHAVELLF
ncbi:hypothetical protein UY3_16307 [Chelonia mydas]|uniref:Uncharacterized protein n=1 Tax=Chelonia mydas TaxID=8469 RepID=M7AN15_CHEMY|nr:hypothetical protein UY3_16307 [Chelonia mydas]